MTDVLTNVRPDRFANAWTTDPNPNGGEDKSPAQKHGEASQRVANLIAQLADAERNVKETEAKAEQMVAEARQAHQNIRDALDAAFVERADVEAAMLGTVAKPVAETPRRRPGRPRQTSATEAPTT